MGTSVTIASSKLMLVFRALDQPAVQDWGMPLSAAGSAQSVMRSQGGNWVSYQQSKTGAKHRVGFWWAPETHGADGH